MRTLAELRAATDRLPGDTVIVVDASALDPDPGAARAPVAGVEWSDESRVAKIVVGEAQG